MDPIARYLERTPGSDERAKRAARLMPGGNTRTIAWHAPYPLSIAKGEGAYLFDVDGNRYLDLLNNYTAAIHGHARREITEAIEAQLNLGHSFSAHHESQDVLAEILSSRVDAVDLVRFCNSGTEAVMHAAGLARHHTGRELIARADGGYHGSWSGLSSALSFPYNDLEGTAAALEPHRDQLAAILIEPVAGVMGVIPADPEYLKGLKEIAERSGALLIVDEVMTLRLAPGGGSELFDLQGDLVTFGKMIGGGLAAGAVGGRRDLMEYMDPSSRRPFNFSGTSNGNPATMVAGVKTLELLAETDYHRMGEQAARLRDGILELGRRLGIHLTVTQFGSLLNTHFRESPPTCHQEREQADREAGMLLHLALLNEGVFTAPRGMMALSTAVDEDDIDVALAGFERALDTVVACRSEV